MPRSKKIKKRAAASPKRKIAAMPRSKKPKPIGKVTHFFTNIGVAIVKFNKNVKAGTVLKFKGATTDFVQPATSMQRNHKPISVAPKGKEVGIKVKEKVREGDEVFEE